MKFTFLGTGSVRGVPVFGCECRACTEARCKQLRRRPCSALLELDGCKLLIDAGLVDLTERFQPGELSAILLTHYHADHVQGLLELRWGVGQSIPVIGPDDPQGCADLYAHPGILDFQVPPKAFTPFSFDGLRVTPLPLQHSKPTFGYLFESASRKLAYLTDTCGLPNKTIAYLSEVDDLELIIDCTEPPRSEPPKGHNDLNLVMQIHNVLNAKVTWLTHLSHTLDCWLLDNALPEGLAVAHDDLAI